MYNVLFWFGVQLILLWVLARTTRTYRDTKTYKMLFFPAAFFEGLLRLLACCVSSVRVKQVDFFEHGRPFAREGGARVPYIGPAVFLTFWLGVFYLVFRSWATECSGLDAHALALPHIDPVAISAGAIEIDARPYLAGIKSFVSRTAWNSWKVWLLLYFVVSSFPFFGVSSRHLRWGFTLIAALGALTFVANYFGIKPGFLSRGWFLTYWVLPDYFRLYSLFLTLLAFTLGMHAGMQTAWRALRSTAARRGRDGNVTKAPQKKRREVAHST